MAKTAKEEGEKRKKGRDHTEKKPFNLPALPSEGVSAKVPLGWNKHTRS